MKDQVLIKWVKKAQMWVKTTVTIEPKTRKQHYEQEWSEEKPQ